MREELVDLLTKIHCGMCEGYADENLCKGVEPTDMDWDGSTVQSIIDICEKYK